MRNRIVTRVNVNREAERLLDVTLPLMGLNVGKVPPVSLAVICGYLGVELYMKPCDSFGAMLVRRGGKNYVMFNGRQPQGRLRFSIAHEIGHLMLNHMPFPNPLDPSVSQIESEADEFAAKILLPERLLSKEPGPHHLNLAELARRYRVSRQALAIRLREWKETARGGEFFLSA